MASFLISFAPPTVRVYAAKGAAATEQEKGLFDWILGNLTKQDQFYETDPLLNKVDDKPASPSAGTTNGRKNSVSVPQKKKNGGVFGGLFAKK